MTAREHYDNHLGRFYSWMAGNFGEKTLAFKTLLQENRIIAGENRVAIDLGAGHGIQSIPLAEMGFAVVAVDFNQHLLSELSLNARQLDITIINDDIRNVRHICGKVGLIVCCGDTLSHLGTKDEVNTLIADIFRSLDDGGKMILSFRDYSTALTGSDRFIPVKSDDARILTCVVDYDIDFVHVTDLLHEKTSEGWVQHVSTYRKVRLTATEVERYVLDNGFDIELNKVVERLITMVAVKRST
jgi:SAM-dependent methyltransferase